MLKWLPFIQLFQELELWKYCDWTFLFPLGKRSRENNFGGMGNIKQRIAGFKDLKFPYWKFINVFVFLVWVFSLWFWKRINVFWHRFLDVRFSTDAWQNDLFVNVVLFTFNHAVSCNAWIMLTSLHHPQNLSYFSRPFTSLRPWRLHSRVDDQERDPFLSNSANMINGNKMIHNVFQKFNDDSLHFSVHFLKEKYQILKQFWKVEKSKNRVQVWQIAHFCHEKSQRISKNLFVLPLLYSIDQSSSSWLILVDGAFVQGDVQGFVNMSLDPFPFWTFCPVTLFVGVCPNLNSS